jgi:hypothetical protein
LGGTDRVEFDNVEVIKRRGSWRSAAMAIASSRTGRWRPRRGSESVILARYALATLLLGVAEQATQIAA